MAASESTNKNTGLANGTARKRREERRTAPANSPAAATPMARPRRSLGKSDAGSPPSVTRQPAGGMASPRRGTGRRSLINSLSSESWVGRRYDIALPGTGAEMRLPALPIIQGDWRFLSAGVVFVFALLAYFFIFSPVFQVDMVDFRGLQRLTPGDVNLVVDAMGKPIIAVSPSQLRDRILTAFPDLASAEVKVILPSKITITVTERQPILVWVQGGTERWIDAEGMVFPIRGSLAIQAGESITATAQTLITLQAESLPPPPKTGDELLATIPASSEQASFLAAAAALGMNGTLQVDPALVSNILVLSKSLPPNTALIYTNAHGLGWRDPGGWDVYFGVSFSTSSSADLDQKQLVYQEILKYLAAKNIQPALVSVENVHAPYYRMER